MRRCDARGMHFSRILFLQAHSERYLATRAFWDEGGCVPSRLEKPGLDFAATFCAEGAETGAVGYRYEANVQSLL